MSRRCSPRQAGRIAAALDVYYRGHAAGHPFTRVQRVLTPHFGYGVVEVFDEYYAQSVENALAFLNGNPVRVLERAGH